jgi:putative nucleotidyltransferase with HDIG domain
MASGPGQSTSIFSQKLDRIVFTSYFLGAVVPLVALAVVVDRFVLPDIADRLAWLGLLALVISIASLSLGSFLAVRRSTHRTLDQMDSDNRRLAALLEASGSFAKALHESEAAATTVRCALQLTEADAVYIFTGAGELKPPSLLQSLGRGAEKLLQDASDAVAELTEFAMTEGRPVLRGPGDGDGWNNLVAAAVPLSGENAPIGALIALQSGTGEAFDAREVDALATLAALASVSLRNSDLRDAQRNFFAHMTELVVIALDAHLRQQNGHGNRVAQYANRVGRELQLDEAQLQRLHFAALLHDIGMLRIDRKHMENPKAYEQHPRVGARMLERIRLWERLAPIVLHHHERFDGGGYPDGISEDAIPLEARIIAVCESFDVMVSGPGYKNSDARDVDSALRELSECAGSQFDPRIVSTFQDLITRGVIEPIVG